MAGRDVSDPGPPGGPAPGRA